MGYQRVGAQGGAGPAVDVVACHRQAVPIRPFSLGQGLEDGRLVRLASRALPEQPEIGVAGFLQRDIQRYGEGIAVGAERGRNMQDIERTAVPFLCDIGRIITIIEALVVLRRHEGIPFFERHGGHFIAQGIVNLPHGVVGQGRAAQADGRGVLTDPGKLLIDVAVFFDIGKRPGQYLQILFPHGNVAHMGDAAAADRYTDDGCLFGIAGITLPGASQELRRRTQLTGNDAACVFVRNGDMLGPGGEIIAVPAV